MNTNFETVKTIIGNLYLENRLLKMEIERLTAKIVQLQNEMGPPDDGPKRKEEEGNEHYE